MAPSDMGQEFDFFFCFDPIFRSWRRPIPFLIDYVECVQGARGQCAFLSALVSGGALYALMPLVGLFFFQSAYQPHHHVAPSPLSTSALSASDTFGLYAYCPPTTESCKVPENFVAFANVVSFFFRLVQIRGNFSFLDCLMPVLN